MKFLTTASELATAIIDRPQWVAECLQRINRFGGQHPTSNVLLHSLDVYDLLVAEGDHSDDLMVWSLLHDCHEILTGDIVRYCKHPDMLLFQSEIDDVLVGSLGIQMTNADWKTIKSVDQRSGNEEREQWGDVIYPYTKDPVAMWVDVVTTWTEGPRETSHDREIPEGVYWNVESANFYTESDRRGCGMAFYLKWRDRSGEFPLCDGS